MPFIKKMFRYHILIKGQNLNNIKNTISEFYANHKNQKIKIFIDVDPQSMM